MQTELKLDIPKLDVVLYHSDLLLKAQTVGGPRARY